MFSVDFLKKKIKENNILFIIVTIFTLIQVLLVTFQNTTCSTDEVTYIKLGKSILDNGFYPSKKDIYSSYIFAPGFINYLKLLFQLSNTNLKFVQYINIIINLVILFETYYLARKLFSIKVAYISMLIYCFYISNIGLPMYILTEIIFCFLCYGGLCLFISDKKINLYLSGVCLALANWVRPIILPFILALIFYIILRKISIFKFKDLIIGYMVIFLLIGTSTYFTTGYFITSSSTSGYNLIMGANKDSTGRQDTTVFEEGNIGCIENIDNYTFKERNKIWTNEAVNWIINNPVQYVKLLPKKIAYLWGADFAFIPAIAGYKSTGNEFIQNLKEFYNNIKIQHSISNYKELKLIIFCFIDQIYYMCILVYSFKGMIKSFKYSKNNFYLLFSIIFLGSCMTLVTVGGLRYHYPFMLAVILLAAYYLESNKKIINLLGDYKG